MKLKLLLPFITVVNAIAADPSIKLRVDINESLDRRLKAANLRMCKVLSKNSNKPEEEINQLAENIFTSWEEHFNDNTSIFFKIHKESNLQEDDILPRHIGEVCISKYSNNGQRRLGLILSLSEDDKDDNTLSLKSVMNSLKEWSIKQGKANTFLTYLPVDYLPEAKKLLTSAGFTETEGTINMSGIVYRGFSYD